jgi:hypothetical protein
VLLFLLLWALKAPPEALLLLRLHICCGYLLLVIPQQYLGPDDLVIASWACWPVHCFPRPGINGISPVATAAIRHQRSAIIMRKR